MASVTATPIPDLIRDLQRKRPRVKPGAGTKPVTKGEAAWPV